MYLSPATPGPAAQVSASDSGAAEAPKTAEEAKQQFASLGCSGVGKVRLVFSDGFSYDFSYGCPWFSIVFPMFFQWFCPMLFLLFSVVFSVFVAWNMEMLLFGCFIRNMTCGKQMWLVIFSRTMYKKTRRFVQMLNSQSVNF